MGVWPKIGQWNFALGNIKYKSKYTSQVVSWGGKHKMQNVKANKRQVLCNVEKAVSKEKEKVMPNLRETEIRDWENLGGVWTSGYRYSEAQLQSCLSGSSLFFESPKTCV